MPERKNARLIVPVQSKEDGSQDLKPDDVNNVMAIGVNNTVSIDVNNTVIKIIKDDKENDSKLEYNADSKEILHENLCIT